MWPGIGKKANDSLADIFDKTTYSEYESCPRGESCDADQDITHMEEREDEDAEVEGDHDCNTFTFSHLKTWNTFLTIMLCLYRWVPPAYRQKTNKVQRWCFKQVSHVWFSFLALQCIFLRYLTFFTFTRNKSFACVEVVRKKDERRKLKGHYCKECEIVSVSWTSFIYTNKLLY